MAEIDWVSNWVNVFGHSGRMRQSSKEVDVRSWVGGKPGIVKHILNMNISTCHLVDTTKEDVSLCARKTCILVAHEDMYSCWASVHIVVLSKKTCDIAEQKHMSLVQQTTFIMCSCSTRRNVLLFHNKICLRVEQEDMHSCSTGGHVILLNKKQCLMVQQKDMAIGWNRRHVIMIYKKTCMLAHQTVYEGAWW